MQNVYDVMVFNSLLSPPHFRCPGPNEAGHITICSFVIGNQARRVGDGCGSCKPSDTTISIHPYTHTHTQLSPAGVPRPIRIAGSGGGIRAVTPESHMCKYVWCAKPGFLEAF